MIKKFFVLKIFLIYFILISNGFTKQSDYFNKAKALFDNKEIDKSKFLFERDIVFNPMSEKSYLYLAKIFNINGNDIDQETNLNNVLLINPKNEEAIYMLMLLKIKLSDYNKATELLDSFLLVCNSFCYKKNDLDKKLKKLTPGNEENNN